MRLWFGAVALVLAQSPVLAQQPQSHSSLSEWFEGLKVPGTSASCCGVSDCRVARARVVGNHYEAMIDGYWAWIPDQAIVRRPNPVGEPIICYSPTKIYCFVPGPGA